MNDMAGKSAGIKSWPEGERPRERLQKLGPQALSEAELLAILLGTGERGRNALDIAKNLMNERRSLREIARLSPTELMKIRSIGKAKALQIVAAFELGRRLEASTDDGVTIIAGPEDVAHRMIPALRDRCNEIFMVLVLDARNTLRAEVELTRGTLTASLVHPREVFKTAIERLAASIIVVHNHPSGNPEPSAEDIEITRQLVETGKVVGIPLHDHIIVAGTSYVSLAERGLV